MRPWPRFAARRRTAARPRRPDAVNGEDDLVRRQNRSLAGLLRLGRFADARRLFAALPGRNVVTWNSLLASFSRRLDLEGARRLFDEMPRRDVVSWNSLLSGYALAGHLAAARRLFDEMPVKDTVSWNTMIAAYARGGRMADAKKLFDEMPQRNVVSWNTMVTGFFAAGQVKQAIKMFETMPVKDGASLSALVSGFVKNGWLQEAEEVLTKSVNVHEINKAVDAYNTLIAGYGHAQRVHDARRVFDMIPRAQCRGEKSKTTRFERNVVSWNSMMMCYIRAQDVRAARALFDEMPDKDSVSWNTVIAMYVRALDMEEAERLFWETPDPDAVSWNLLIQGYAQKGEVERARRFFDTMTNRNAISWNTMISGYERNGDHDTAIKLFTEMQTSSCERPDRHTLSSVLAACATLAMLCLGAQVHQLIEKAFAPDTPISNALITMYSKCGQLADARVVFEGMQTQKDFVSWNAIIGGYAHHGLAVEALELFEEMKRTNVKPTHVTFISLLNACGHAGLVSEGRRVFDAMVHEFGVAARVEHYASLVDLVGRHGRVEDASELINQMEIAPDRAVWGAFLGACRVHKNAPLAQMAAKALAKVEPESSVPYVLMHNLHVDEGRWENATEVRKLMDRHGIVKQPGYSWIETHNNVHVFVSGDTSHPLSHEIFSFLECFHRVIRQFADTD